MTARVLYLRLMKRALLVIGLILPAISLNAQTTPAPIIASIEPSSGPPSGGTLVKISGSHFDLPPDFACILPCPPKVRFGNEEVESLEHKNDLITVRTPPHSPATVDVTVTTGDGRTARAANAFTYAPIQAGYEVFLLPVYLDGKVSGSGASSWATEFWIRNQGEKTVLLAPWNCPADQICPAIVPLTRALAPQESLRNLPAFFRPPSPNPARLLYVGTEGAAAVSTNLRVFELSRNTVDAGTDIPVIREKDFRAGSIELLAVPVNDHFRLLLRIYDMTQSESKFRIRILEQHEGVDQKLVRTVELTGRSSDSEPFPLQPAYAQYTGLGEQLPAETTAIRVAIEPLTTGSLYWAFVSVTNNDTQRVTLVTPR